jgi:hypothetical protein
MNPDFFKGTAVEPEAAKVLAAQPKQMAAANYDSSTFRSDTAK